jgi:hypothetical protein
MVLNMMNFEVKIVEYKLTDLKKEVQDALMLLNASDVDIRFGSFQFDSSVWPELIQAGWVYRDDGGYGLTDDGVKLIREHNRQKLKRRWFR